MLIRTSLIIGDDRSKQIGLALDLVTGRRPGALFTDEIRCPIAVQDLAAAVLELADSGLRGPAQRGRAGGDEPRRDGPAGRPQPRPGPVPRPDLHDRRGRPRPAARRRAPGQLAGRGAAADPAAPGLGVHLTGFAGRLFAVTLAGVQPTIVQRDEQPYVGRRESITMTEFARVADHLPAMFGSLAERGAPIAGPPFFRYRVIDMSAELVVEAGIPVAGPVAVDEPPSSTRCRPAGTPRSATSGTRTS